LIEDPDNNRKYVDIEGVFEIGGLGQRDLASKCDFVLRVGASFLEEFDIPASLAEDVRHRIGLLDQTLAQTKDDDVYVQVHRHYQLYLTSWQTHITQHLENVAKMAHQLVSHILGQIVDLLDDLKRAFVQLGNDLTEFDSSSYYYGHKYATEVLMEWLRSRDEDKNSAENILRLGHKLHLPMTDDLNQLLTYCVQFETVLTRMSKE